MKMLKVENAHAYLQTSEDAVPKMIKDIDENDVLEMVNTIMGNKDVSVDEDPSPESCPNDAERIIYVEIAQQIRNLLEKREGILDEIDRQFGSAEELYAKKKPVSSFEEWTTDNGGLH